MIKKTEVSASVFFEIPFIVSLFQQGTTTGTHWQSGATVETA